MIHGSLTKESDKDTIVIIIILITTIIIISNNNVYNAIQHLKKSQSKFHIILRL